MAIHLAFSIPTLRLQIPAAFSPVNFLTASLASAREGGLLLIGKSAAAICNASRGSCSFRGSAVYKVFGPTSPVPICILFYMLISRLDSTRLRCNSGPEFSQSSEDTFKVVWI